MRKVSDTQVEFMVTLNNPGWCGLVLGDSGMATGSDMVLFFGDGTFASYTSVGYRAPSKDSFQSLSASPEGAFETNADGSVTVFARRSLNTGDAGDYVIPLNAEIVLGYAYNDTTNEMRSKHSAAGATKGKLMGDQPLRGTMPTVVTAEPAPEPASETTAETTTETTTEPSAEPTAETTVVITSDFVKDAATLFTTAVAFATTSAFLALF